ncbi:phytoene desaturase family protein [Bacteroidia bacterium]|nr:phytoene desaturase family protein [Bacteroidia bacterium]
MTHQKKDITAIVIGAGIAGLSSAIRLAAKGVHLTVLEQQDTYGGKMGVWEQDGYRYDTGPSLFTMPQYVDELLTIDGKNDVTFEYDELENIGNYFWEDGTQMTATKDVEQLKDEFLKQLSEPKENIDAYLADSKIKFEITNHVFLEKSLHKLKTYLSWGTVKSFFRLSKVDIFKNMNAQNELRFNNPKTVQFFNRYATYNGSNPYQASATLNVIPHYEFGFGAFFPKKGIRSIADALYQKAIHLGVIFQFSTQVSKVEKIGERYIVNGDTESDILICNMDVASAAKGPLKNFVSSKRKKYEPSSSALIFYWGIDREFKELDLHNIFFSSDYMKEFENIFHNRKIDNDPTVYIHISSKCKVDDAPVGCENWFVMVNAPYVAGQDWEKMINEARENILIKVSKRLGTDISRHIRLEHKLTPELIQSKTGSYKGALYGSSSNDRMAAFLRQPNFSSGHKGLYFCGGSVHPGGGIPLCLLSGKITTDIIAHDFKLY